MNIILLKMISIILRMKNCIKRIKKKAKSFDLAFFVLLVKYVGYFIPNEIFISLGEQICVSLSGCSLIYIKP